MKERKFKVGDWVGYLDKDMHATVEAINQDGTYDINWGGFKVLNCSEDRLIPTCNPWHF